ncbi:MAG: hypothetical protein ACRCXX_04085 [Cetobacterium sp.]|uniref:hypothetical protein n=1 Tax=Cetobacterium sp. TaxID=2071632 RepID=UPI003F2F2721
MIELITENIKPSKAQTDKAREFCLKVANMADELGLPVFIVTDGASATRNTDCDAVRNARDAHKVWEKKHGISSTHDWNKK